MAASPPAPTPALRNTPYGPLKSSRIPSPPLRRAGSPLSLASSSKSTEELHPVSPVKKSKGPSTRGRGTPKPVRGRGQSPQSTAASLTISRQKPRSKDSATTKMAAEHTVLSSINRNTADKQTVDRLSSPYPARPVEVEEPEPGLDLSVGKPNPDSSSIASLPPPEESSENPATTLTTDSVETALLNRAEEEPTLLEERPPLTSSDSTNLGVNHIPTFNSAIATIDDPPLDGFLLPTMDALGPLKRPSMPEPYSSFSLLPAVKVDDVLDRAMAAIGSTPNSTPNDSPNVEPLRFRSASSESSLGPVASVCRIRIVARRTILSLWGYCG